MGVRTLRVYDDPGERQGKVFLVERLWPRGLRKDALGAVTWLREVAPSTDLRKWFGHDPTRWAGFRDRYRRELADRPDELAPLLDAASSGGVTLLYSARDREHNSALVLAEVVESKT